MTSLVNCLHPFIYWGLHAFLISLTRPISIKDFNRLWGCCICLPQISGLVFDFGFLFEVEVLNGCERVLRHPVFDKGFWFVLLCFGVLHWSTFLLYPRGLQTPPADPSPIWAEPEGPLLCQRPQPMTPTLLGIRPLISDNCHTGRGQSPTLQVRR